MNISFIFFLIFSANSVMGKKGVTFIKTTHNARFGIDRLSCGTADDYAKGTTCNPYQGDTGCETLLPVLCLKIDSSPRPAYPITCGSAAMDPEFYCGWTRGHIATTTPIRGSQFRTRKDVDAFCAATFGVDWRIQSWSDTWYIPGMNQQNGSKYSGDEWSANAHRMLNGAWGFFSYGDIRNDTRLWIEGPLDQSSGCWTH